MALTVEDGTGLANADALISLAFANTYHTDQGNAAWTGTDAAKESAIRRATAFLSAPDFAWKGWRTRGRSQALAWPRVDAYDHEGYSIPADVIPPELQRACAEVALRELVTPGAMAPDVTMTERVKSETVGPISVEYATPSGAESSRPILLVVRDLIAGLVKSTGGHSGLAVRG